jgi:pimeloyl-ACP methyl ester carboxylesterase
MASIGDCSALAGVSPRSTPRALLLVTTLLGLGCAGPTRKVPPAESPLGQLPGRWDNLFVTVPAADGPLQMHYLAAGPRDAPRVLLLHGFPDFSYTWREIVPLLAGEYRVIAPDLRGYAATAKPRKGYDLDNLAADILAFADASAKADGAPDATPTHLIGHDWGAAIGWWTVLAAPQRFTSFTALSVPHPRTFNEFLERSPEQRKRSRYMRLLTFPGVPAVIAGMRDKKRKSLYRDDLARKDAFGDVELIWYRTAFDSTWETRGPLRYYQQKFRRAKANNAAARARPKVTTPVLVLWGQQDKYLMWAMAAESCKYVEDGKCTVHVFPDVSHWPHWDDPQGVVQRWRAFVAGAPVPAAAATDAAPTDAAPTDAAPTDAAPTDAAPTDASPPAASPPAASAPTPG